VLIQRLFKYSSFTVYFPHSFYKESSRKLTDFSPASLFLYFCDNIILFVKFLISVYRQSSLMAEDIYGRYFPIPAEHYERSFMSYGIKSCHAQSTELEKRHSEMMMYQNILI